MSSNKYVAPYQQAYATASTFDPLAPSSANPPPTKPKSSAMLLCLAILCPPYPVFRIHGCGDEFAFCLILTLFGIFPGIIYAILCVRQDLSGAGGGREKRRRGSRKRSVMPSPGMQEKGQTYQGYQQQYVESQQSSRSGRKASTVGGMLAPVSMDGSSGIRKLSIGRKASISTSAFAPLPGQQQRRPSSAGAPQFGRRPSTAPGLVSGVRLPSASAPAAPSPLRRGSVMRGVRPPSTGGPAASGPGLDPIMEDIMMSDDSGSLIDGTDDEYEDDERTMSGSVGAMDYRRGPAAMRGMYPGPGWIHAGGGSLMVDALPTMPPPAFWE